MKHTITVTAEDIAQGLRLSPSACPIAKAVYRATDWAVLVDGTNLLTGGDGTVKLPTEAQTFINRFDNGMLVVPFSFEVNLPDEATNA